MKKLFIIALLISGSVYSQGSIKVTFTQDAKLALMEDDHGNSPWTWNTTTKVQFQEYQKGIGFPVVGVKFEYADLDSGSYYRYGAEAGYTFQTFPVRDGFDDRPLISLTPLVGYGVGKRSFTNAFSSLEVSGEITLNVSKKLGIVSMHTYTQREGFWRYAHHVGLQYTF